MSAQRSEVCGWRYGWSCVVPGAHANHCVLYRAPCRVPAAARAPAHSGAGDEVACTPDRRSLFLRKIRLFLRKTGCYSAFFDVKPPLAGLKISRVSTETVFFQWGPCTTYIRALIPGATLSLSRSFIGLFMCCFRDRVLRSANKKPMLDNNKIVSSLHYLLTICDLI